MATKESAAGFKAKTPHHLLPEDRRWPQKGQHQVLKPRDQVTYCLKVKDNHQRVSIRF